MLESKVIIDTHQRRECVFVDLQYKVSKILPFTKKTFLFSLSVENKLKSIILIYFVPINLSFFAAHKKKVMLFYLLHSFTKRYDVYLREDAHLMTLKCKDVIQKKRLFFYSRVRGREAHKKSQ